MVDGEADRDDRRPDVGLVESALDTVQDIFFGFVDAVDAVERAEAGDLTGFADVSLVE